MYLRGCNFMDGGSLLTPLLYMLRSFKEDAYLEGSKKRVRNPGVLVRGP
jgi:hypothetical protein